MNRVTSPQRKRVGRRPGVTEPVILPTLPNFLRTDSGACVPIEAVTDAGLLELARLWGRALVRKARNKRRPAPAERQKKGEAR
jgi:hypothetical protein